jgi:hypothetical protein
LLRRLAGDGRAGSWARAQAAGRQLKFLRENWSRLAVVVVVAAALLGPSASRPLMDRVARPDRYPSARSCRWRTRDQCRRRQSGCSHRQCRSRDAASRTPFIAAFGRHACNCPPPARRRRPTGMAVNPIAPDASSPLTLGRCPDAWRWSHDSRRRYRSDTEPERPCYRPVGALRHWPPSEGARAGEQQ